MVLDLYLAICSVLFEPCLVGLPLSWNVGPAEEGLLVLMEVVGFHHIVLLNNTV